MNCPMTFKRSTTSGMGQSPAVPTQVIRSPSTSTTDPTMGEDPSPMMAVPPTRAI